MSLLLEALKKAEKAKEEAQRRAREDRPAGEPEELRNEAAPAEATAEPRPDPAAVLTRDNLPEISPRLEILADDFLDKPAVARKPAPAEPPPEPAPRASPPPRPSQNEARAEASRASARKVFEAKFREPNPRMPFYITMGCLGAFAVGTVIYFYIQLRPPAPLVNTNPPPPQQQVVTAVEAARPASSAEASSNPSAIPGLPGSAPVAPAPSAPQTTSSSAAVTPTPPVAAEPTQKPAPKPRLAQRLSPALPMSSRMPPPALGGRLRANRRRNEAARSSAASYTGSRSASLAEKSAIAR